MTAMSPHATRSARRSATAANNNHGEASIDQSNICERCGKCFTRSEHLQRHFSSHLNDKAWHCEFCGKGFGRRDVLNRHFKSCKQAVAGARTNIRNFNRACLACSEQKVKCDSQTPCARCASHSVECTYPLRRNKAAPPSTTVENGFCLADDSAVDQAQISSNAVQRSSSGHCQPDIQVRLSEESPRQGSDDVEHSLNHTVHLQGADLQPQSFMSLLHDPYADANAMFPNMDSGLDVLDWLHLSGQYDQSSMQLPDGSVEQIFSPEFLPPTHSAVMENSQSTGAEASLPSRRSHFLVELSQINPLGDHRTRILRFLSSKCNIASSNLDWLTQDNIERLLKKFFSAHQKHTPILHLPHWNISSTTTPLVFAMILISLSYLPEFFTKTLNIGTFVEAGYKMAIESDTEIPQPHAVTLQNLQAIVFLSILDKLMLNGRHGKPVLDLADVINLARAGRYFDEEENKAQHDDVVENNSGWQSWALSESRRRTVFVIFAFDAFVSLLDDRLPLISSSEMRVFLPSPDNMFLAASQEEWNIVKSAAEPIDPMPFCVALSLLLSESNPRLETLPSLLGSFTVLHGVLAHVWEVHKIRLSLEQTRSSNLQGALVDFVTTRSEVIRHALDIWYNSWTSALHHPLCSSAISPGLYKDRSMVYWYLCGILTLPDLVIASKNTPASDSRALPIKEILKRLLMRHDRGQLENCAGDFTAARQLVLRNGGEDATRIPIASLLFQE